MTSNQPGAVESDVIVAHPHDFGTPPDFARIPMEIRGGKWCVWSAVPKKNGKIGFDKIPSNGAHPISTKDPGAWLSYNAAVWTYERNPGFFNGIGRLVERDGLTFIDVDRMDAVPAAVSLFPTYWEKSPSGEGARGIVRGNVSRDISSPIEIYSGNAPRFVTITGHHLYGTPAKVEPRAEEVEQYIYTHAPVSFEVNTPDRPPVWDAYDVPAGVNLEPYHSIPDDCLDRSAELMRIVNLLQFQGMQPEALYSFLAASDWLQVGLDHRRNDEDKALQYLWETVCKSSAYVEGKLSTGIDKLFKPVNSFTLAVGDDMARSQMEDVFADLQDEPPRFNPDHWPSVLADYAQEVATDRGADPLTPAFAGLWAISTACDKQSLLKLRKGWVVPPIVWSFVIGDPATKKSPATKPMLDIVVKLEREAVQAHAAQLEYYERQNQMYERRRAQQVRASDMENDVTPESVELPPPRPIELRLMVTDSTGPGMRRELAERPRGLGLNLDEMSDFIRNQAMTNTITPERGFWNQAFEGGFARISRAGEGSIPVKNLAVSIFGNVQPGFIMKAAKDLAVDGLMQRFIPVPLHRATMGSPIPEFLSCEWKWEECIRRVFALPAQEYTLSPAAVPMVESFEAEVMRLVEYGCELHWDARHLTSLGKMTGLLGRIALLFHLFEGQGTVVQVPTMARALRLMREYVLKAQAYFYNRLMGSDNETFIHWLDDALLVHPDQTITLRDIKRTGKRRPEIRESRSLRAKDEVVLGAMQGFESAGWVSVLRSNAQTTEWVINPGAKEQFAPRAERRRKMRQEVVESILGGLQRYE